MKLLVTNKILFLQPKIQVASKYERRVDTRSYDDKKKLFEGVSRIFNSSKENWHYKVIFYFIIKRRAEKLKK